MTNFNMNRITISDPVKPETFKTKGQYNRYIKIKKYFETLIELKGKGCIFMVDGELWAEPFINGVKIGFKEGNSYLCFIGCSHGFNKQTDEYDIPWVDITLKELRERVVPMKKIKV